MRTTFKDLKFGKCWDGVQSLVQFGDYQLSIVKHSTSYGGKQGLYEIAVFKDDDQVELPGITQEGDTVKGWLTEADVDGIMLKMTTVSASDPVPLEVDNKTS